MHIHKQTAATTKTDPMPSLDSYMKDDPHTLVLTHEGQNSPRGRAISQKDLSTTQDEQHDNADLSKSLKIKLTLPAGFRKTAVEAKTATTATVSRPSRNTRKVKPPSATTVMSSPTALPKRGRPRKNKNSGEADEYAPPRGLKPPHKTTTATVIRSSASGPSRLPQHHQIYHPSPDQHHKPRFPTFVPASVLSSDDLSGSEDSDDETEEDELPDDLVANDRAIAHDRAHTHRKLFESEEDQIPTRVPWKYNNHTNSRRTTPVVKTPIEMDDGSRSSGNEEDDEQSSDEDEDEDEDDDEEEEGPEAEGEPDQPTPMQTTGLSDEEDDTMDAQLFFSHLLDESSESEDEARSDGDSIAGDMVAGAAELSDTETDIEIEGLEHPMMVKEGWDGELVFSTEIHPPAGLLDFTFGHDDSQLDLSSSQTDSLANSLSTLPVTQSATISDNEEFEEAESLAGDTTDDEIMPPGLASFPPSTSTISPFATFTPAKAMASMHQLAKGAPPSPADVMAARNSFTWDMLSSPVNSIAATDDAPPRSRSASTHSLGYRGPKMGFFNGAVFGSMRTIIGDAGGKLPSPFSTLVPPAPTYRRKRRANSDLGSFFNKRTRNSHSLQSSYFSDDLITAPQGDLVDLDDLLDASLLSEDIDKPSSETNDATPNKWDRIPMSIYRQTRNIPAAHGSSVSFSFDIGGFGTPPPPLSKPAYVPPNRSHVSHGSIDSILWEDEFMSPSLVRRPNHHQHNKKRHREHEIEFDIDSLLPASSRAGPSRGDRTPTQSRSMAGESSAEFLSEAKSRKDRRKEKKREKACLQKQILSALDETLADYDELMAAEEDITP